MNEQELESGLGNCGPLQSFTTATSSPDDASD